jgi:hypothetical protein
VVLNDFSERSRLHQTFFVYQTNLAVFKESVTGISPVSIIPTLFAVGVGLWWSAMDKNFRRLQPFISMSKSPTTFSHGASLSYQTSYWLWAAIRAARNKHWLLCLITIGTTFSQVCEYRIDTTTPTALITMLPVTVSMSALFQRETGSSNQAIMLNNTLEIRQLPMLFDTAGGQDINDGNTAAADVITNLFTGFSTNWMYGAAIQLALNGSQPSWSSSGWSFLPLDVPSIANGTSVQSVGSQSTAMPSNNISLTTSAIGGRIECTPYNDLGNLASWLTKVDLLNSTVWDMAKNPKGMSTGYELGPTMYSQYPANISNPTDWNTAMDTSTSILVNPTIVGCCNNGTDPSPSSVAIGYWSPNNPSHIPFASYSWPINFTVKWIHGQALSGFYQVNDSINHLIFNDIPSIQALNCVPVIESTTANVVVEQNTGQVQSFTIIDEPQSAPEAWSVSFATNTTWETRMAEDEDIAVAVRYVFPKQYPISKGNDLLISLPSSATAFFS